MIINQHEYGYEIKIGDNNVSFCVYCGATKQSSLLSCVDRKSVDPISRRQISCDDIETIYARLKELKAERDQILAKPLEDIK